MSCLAAMIHLSSWLFWLLIIAYAATTVSCIIVVLSENRNPIRSLSWMISLIFLPGIGLIFYLFFGRSLRNTRMISHSSKRRLMKRNKEVSVKVSDTSLLPSRRQLVKLANSLTSAPLTQNNEIEIFTEGNAKFESLERDLSNARHNIFLQYYIFSDDEVGRRIAAILKQKAREGLDVRVIYDHVGSFSSRNRFFKDLREAGVNARPFFRVTFPTLASRINWRNHRKIVVIDNAIGYIGGMNIADRYVKAIGKEGPWRDTHFRVKGDIVSQLLYSFAVDWSFMGQPLLNTGPQLLAHEPNELGIQFVASGPTTNWDNLSLCFLRAISSAHKSIYIQTPYFLPTEALLKALQAAALSKVDVRVMIPRRSDSRLLQLASFSYITECLKAGIKVYLYEEGMLHAKTMIIDEDFVTAGSTNFDFRSLENNFECNLLVFDSDFNRRMRDIFFSDIQHCSKLTYKAWHQRPWHQRLLESIVRLTAPVL